MPGRYVFRHIKKSSQLGTLFNCFERRNETLTGGRSTRKRVPEMANSFFGRVEHVGDSPLKRSGDYPDTGCDEWKLAGCDHLIQKADEGECNCIGKGATGAKRHITPSRKGAFSQKGCGIVDTNLVASRVVRGFRLKDRTAVAAVYDVWTGFNLTHANWNDVVEYAFTDDCV